MAEDNEKRTEELAKDLGNLGDAELDDRVPLGAGALTTLSESLASGVSHCREETAYKYRTYR